METKENPSIQSKRNNAPAQGKVKKNNEHSCRQLRPGMRIIKTSIAVFLCLVTDLFRVSPFPIQSSVTAVICLQPDIHSSKTIAGNRVIGTLAAGIYSFLFLTLFVEWFHIDPKSFTFTFLVSVGIIPLILIILFLERPGSVVIALVVFLATSLTKGDASILHYSVGRVFDTLLGIGFALAVNWFPPLNRHAKHPPEQGNSTDHRTL
jgi:hypothetical protein